jgi:hypothetical protein
VRRGEGGEMRGEREEGEIKKYKRKQQGLGTVPASMGSYQVAQR